MDDQVGLGHLLERALDQLVDAAQRTRFAPYRALAYDLRDARGEALRRSAVIIRLDGYELLASVRNDDCFAGVLAPRTLTKRLVADHTIAARGRAGCPKNLTRQRGARDARCAPSNLTNHGQPEKETSSEDEQAQAPQALQESSPQEAFVGLI